MGQTGLGAAGAKSLAHVKDGVKVAGEYHSDVETSERGAWAFTKL